MIKLNRWWIGGVVAVIVAALFIDGYSYIYRLANHKGLSTTLSSPPSLLGRDLYIHKGLDLQGGTELTIAICQGLNDPEGSTCRTGLPKGLSEDDAQKNTISILQSRVNQLGVSEATVQGVSGNQVLVQLPGVGIDQAIAAIGTTAKLHFATAVAGAPNPSDQQFITDQEGLYDPKQFNDPALYPSGFHWKIDDALPPSDISKADINYDPQKSWVVTLNFSGSGADEWQKITTTASAATANSPQNLIAIFLDNQVLIAPGTQGAQTNNTEIFGNFTQDFAQHLSDEIAAGALPAEIATVQSSEVSATLGQDTVHKSLIAGLVGLIVVVLFMCLYYRFPGVLASIALLFYAAIVLALYKLVPVTVTLAGLAGFVLSVGMAVDANVLIFERTRDELRHGRSVPMAVEMGFRRAFPAIRDSNVSTLIACALLYIFGSSVVRGFALTLALGVVVSFFSAILITQSIFHLVLGWRMARNPQLYTEIHEEYTEHPPRGRFDIVRSRNAFFAASLAIIVPGILAIMVWGFRSGLDFSGGNRIDASLVKPTTQAQVDSTLRSNSDIAKLNPVVQTEANNTFSIRTLPSSIDKVEVVTTLLDKNYGFVQDNGKPKVQVQTVGPTIARSLVIGAVVLILVSSLFIAIYLAIQFRGRTISAWRFSLCTFFKLLHDVFVLAGIWAVIGHFSTLGEVDSLFVTAVLTSVAFSIHDTIVVFDRVRENLRVGPRLTFNQIINLSTVQTMTRSLNTALTVTFVLLALVLFGGDSIRGFVLALLIGIVTGTYSSIFNASTLLVAWNTYDKEKEPPPGVRRGLQRRTATAAGS